jgi:hypothetical protein
MMRTKLWLFTIVTALALAACSETGGTDLAEETTPTAGATGTTTGGTSGETGASETIAELQAEFDDLSEAIAESGTPEELASAWDTLSTEIIASIAALREDRTIAREEIESSVEEFEQSLEDLEVDEDVRTAWEALRSHLEQLMTAN